MRIIWGEMKKIWNWKMLVIISVICVLFYIMFMSYYVDSYRSGNHPQAETVYYAEKLTRLYGTSVTAEQLSDFIGAERALRIAEAEDYIKTMPIFAEAGIYSLDDYIALSEESWDKELTPAESEARRMLYRAETDMVGYKLGALEILEEDFGARQRNLANPNSYDYILNQKELQRLNEIFVNEEYRSTMNYWTYFFTERYIVYFSVLLMLSVLVLVSPLLTSDRHANLHYLQYSSKHGRKIMHGQLIATLLSAFVLTTLMILVFGWIFSQNGTFIFWNNYIINTVFRLTYGEWVVFAVALMYMQALGVSVFAFILSRFSRNMITLTMKLIPVFAALAFLCVSVFENLFVMGNALYRIIKVFGTEAYICGAITVIALAAMCFVMRREKRVDVM